MARWMRKPCNPAEIPSKKCARKVVRASVEHARSNHPFVVLRQDLNFSSLIVYFNGQTHFFGIPGLVEDILVGNILSHLKLTSIFDRRDSEIPTQSVLIAFHRLSRFFTDSVGSPESFEPTTV